MALNSYLLPKEWDPWVSNKNKTAPKFYKKKYSTVDPVFRLRVFWNGDHILTSYWLYLIFHHLVCKPLYRQCVSKGYLSPPYLTDHTAADCPHPCRLIHCCLCLIKAHSDNLPTKLLLCFYRILGERDEVQIRSETQNSVSRFSVKWERYESRVSTYHLFLTPIR